MLRRRLEGLSIQESGNEMGGRNWVDISPFGQYLGGFLNGGIGGMCCLQRRWRWWWWLLWILLQGELSVTFVQDVHARGDEETEAGEFFPFVLRESGPRHRA